MSDSESLKTHMLDIAMRIRRGLGLPDSSFPAAYYDSGSFTMMFRHEDGKLYAIRIQEVRHDEPNE